MSSFSAHPPSSTRIRGPTPGTIPRSRHVLAVLPGPCRGNPLNSSKNSAVARTGVMTPIVACHMPPGESDRPLCRVYRSNTPFRPVRHDDADTLLRPGHRHVDFRQFLPGIL